MTEAIPLVLKVAKGTSFVGTGWLALPRRRFCNSAPFVSACLSFRCVFPQ